MKKLTLEAPWYAYGKKVNALFGEDPAITVGEVYECDGGTDYAMDIEISDHKKFVALDRAIPKTVTFGDVTLGIVLFDEENNAEESGIEIFKTIFEGNPHMKDFKDITDFTGTRHGFVRFKPEVIQFLHDDLSDYNGKWSGLAQDIAREVFKDDRHHVHFCTAGIHEDDG